MLSYTVPSALLNNAKEKNATMGIPSVQDNDNTFLACILEMLFSFVLIIVFLKLDEMRFELERKGMKSYSGFAMGLVYGCGIISIGPVTGSSINPFRFLGPALLILEPW